MWNLMLRFYSGTQLFDETFAGKTSMLDVEAGGTIGNVKDGTRTDKQLLVFAGQ